METKKWYQSKTIWGAIVMLVSLILVSITGVGIGEAEQESSVNTIVALAEGAGTLVGFILVIVGRIKASKKIGGGSEAAKAIKSILVCLLLPAFCLLSLSGCATLGIGGGGGGTPFDKLTQDEQARVVISATQNGSDLLFDVGRGVMIVKPEYKAAWKLAVVPSFDSLNKILLDLETKGGAGQKIDVPAVLTSVQGRIAEIVSLIAQYGSIGKTAGSKPTSDDYALIAILGIGAATVAWNDIVAAMSGQIPTWEVIKARNGILQMKIDAEK